MYETIALLANKIRVKSEKIEYHEGSTGQTSSCTGLAISTLSEMDGDSEAIEVEELSDISISIKRPRTDWK